MLELMLSFIANYVVDKYLIMNILDSLIIATFCAGYLGSRFDGKKKYLGLALYMFLYVLLFSVMTYLNNILTEEIADIIASLSALLLSYLFCLFYLKGNPLQKIFPLCIWTSVNIVVTAIIMILYMYILELLKISQDTATFIVMAIFAKVILFYVFRIILNYKQKDEYLIKPKNWIIIVIAPIFSFAVCVLLLPSLNTAESIGSRVTICVIAVLLFASNIITYYLYVNTIKNSRATLQLEQLKQQHEYERRHYSEMTKKYEEIRVIRHNIKNQLIYLESAMKDGKNDESVKYINKLTRNVEYTGDYVRTNNYAVNCILNAMITKAAELKIHVTAQIAENIGITIDPLDVTVILGNLMENAMEASLKLNEAERKIRISIEHDMTGLLIRITNKVENSVLKNNPKFITDKQDKSFHGLGVQSVKKLVHKYDGLMMCQEEDNNFIWTIVFNEISEHNENTNSSDKRESL